MSKSKKNKGKSKSKGEKRAWVKAIYTPIETKGQPAQSLIETFKSVGFGLAGAGIGVAVGKPSLFFGLATSMLGNLLDFQPLKEVSIGMIAAGGYSFAKGLSGQQKEGFEGVKDRLKTFGANLKENLYLDKLFKPKTIGTSGLGDVQYFDPKKEEFNMGSLDALEEQIAGSGEQFQEQISGSQEEAQILGLEEERIY